ncbi:hypothetical protein PSAL_007980 [Pseudooceanicola algae]|uniref:Uncharacterized protein n=1 Tax=Pseudooceanicola algae TaxID=1537215 RepID=A0A418SE54_9RHOB|nr:hypothetical protein PSAL_007980 [Pseudooceanicola algae]
MGCITDVSTCDTHGFRNTRHGPAAHGFLHARHQSKCAFRSIRREKTPSPETIDSDYKCAQRSALRGGKPRSHHLAKLEEIPPPCGVETKRLEREVHMEIPRRSGDALHEATEAAPHYAGPRPASCGSPIPHRPQDRMSRTCHPHYKGRETNATGERRGPLSHACIQKSQPEPDGAPGATSNNYSGQHAHGECFIDAYPFPTSLKGQDGKQLWTNEVSKKIFSPVWAALVMSLREWRGSSIGKQSPEISLKLPRGKPFARQVIT